MRKVIEKKGFGNIRKIRFDNEKKKEDRESLLQKQIRNLMKKEGVIEENFKERFNKIKKIDVSFDKIMIINNVYIDNIFYKKMEFNRALLYAEEIVPSFCFKMPKLYETNVLGYDPKNNRVFLYVKRRKV